MDFQEISKVAHAKVDKLLLQIKEKIETADCDLDKIIMAIGFHNNRDICESIDFNAWRSTCEVLEARGIEAKKEN